ncbi:hypothetical protein V8G54_031404, partial [Vigna mungo]
RSKSSKKLRGKGHRVLLLLAIPTLIIESQNSESNQTLTTAMVCEKCEKKLTKVIVPDKWKEGASNTTEGGGRKINENKLLSKKNSKLYASQWEATHICDLTWRYWSQDFLAQLSVRRVASKWTPYGNTKCIICKQQVHQDAKYCHTCAYSKGVCAMCGKQVLDTKFYKQSNV